MEGLPSTRRSRTLVGEIRPTPMVSKRKCALEAGHFQRRSGRLPTPTPGRWEEGRSDHETASEDLLELKNSGGDRMGDCTT